MRRLLIFLSVVLLPFWMAGAMVASASQTSEAVRVEIRPGWQEANGDHIMAIHFHLKPGWKTYWRQPGGNGIPPQFSWAGSGNFRSAAPVWPAPSLISQGGVTIVGYERELVLPFRVKGKNPGKNVDLKVQIDFGVCKDICIPARVQLAGTLAAKATKKDPAIVKALSRRSRSADAAGIAGVTCRIEPGKKSVRLIADIDRQGGFKPPVHVVFELNDPGIWIRRSETRRSGNGITAVADLYVPKNKSLILDRSALGMTLIHRGGAIAIKGCAGS